MKNLKYFLIAAVLIAISSESFARSAKDPQYLQVLASVGPGNNLANARVRVKDANGFVLGQGVTNIRGSVYFPLPRKINGLIPVKLPITFDTSGGLVMDLNTPVSDAAPFKGHLSGRITVLPDRTHVIGYADLATTVATKVNSGIKNYDKALLKTNAALGINKSAPPTFLRYGNPAVGWAELTEAVKVAGGYDRFVLRAKGKILKGIEIEGLRPSRQPLKSRNGQKLHALASSTSSSECTTYGTYGNATFNGKAVTSTSTQNIENIGVAAGETLLTVAGYPGLAEGASMVSGMLLTGGPNGSAATQQALSTVETQLNCIISGLAELQGQIDALQFAMDVLPATQCQADIQNAFQQYSSLVSGAQNNADNTPSSCPLNSTCGSFTDDVASWGPDGSSNLPGCGQIINNMLFGTAGGQQGAWQQLNINSHSSASNGGAWYTQYQVQQLQSFLSYWSTYLYYNFIVTNEFNNYCGQFENSLIQTGSYNNSVTGSSSTKGWDDPSFCNGGPDASILSVSSPSSTTVCAPNTTSTSSSYCAWASNIVNAYPPDLFSDEIGMWNNGLAVNAFPAYSDGVSSNGLSGSSIVVSWLIDNYAMVTGGYPASNATGTTYTTYNGLGVNPQGLSSGVENYLNPQALRTIQLTSSQVASLASNGPANPLPTTSVGSPWTAASFFLTAINGVSGSPWTTYSTSDVSFYASDNVTTFTDNYYLDEQIVVDLGAIINNQKSGYPVNPKSGGGYTCNGSCKPNYSMGVLLGRTWWPGASSATNYNPPNPPTP